jgi:hypothetical protein
MRAEPPSYFLPSVPGHDRAAAASRRSVSALLAQRCLDLKWLRRMSDSRALIVTPAGRRGLSEAFGLSL